jgi:hypothetical protein
MSVEEEQEDSLEAELEIIDVKQTRDDCKENISEKLKTLRMAHRNLVKALNESINLSIKKQLQKNIKSTFVVIFEPHKEADLLGVPLDVLLWGYYNKEKEEYNRRKHEKAGIGKEPLDYLEEFYGKTNTKFSIEDISNKDRSQMFVVKVHF